MTRLEYKGKPYGPAFTSQRAANKFAAWVERRTGLEFQQQTEATLERLAGTWAKEKAAKVRAHN